MVSLGSLIALQCFTIYITSNLNTLGVWTHDSRLIQNFHGDCFFSPFISLWKMLPSKNHRIIQHFRSEGTPGNYLIHSPAQSRANFQVSTTPCSRVLSISRDRDTIVLQAPALVLNQPYMMLSSCNLFITGWRCWYMIIWWPPAISRPFSVGQLYF